MFSEVVCFVLKQKRALYCELLNFMKFPLITQY
jgi:hypothetical protein